MGVTLRNIRSGERRLEIVWPDVGDARLHVAAVIISIHVIGITALGFRVSVPQILSAIVPAALVDVVIVLRRTGRLVWPASALLTGSGVALILRVVGMESGDFWAWEGWHHFALVAVISVLAKHTIRHRDEHVFNPSNVGLVVAFLVLGSGVIEPLDFWWAPLDAWMGLVYLVILGGGVAITARLGLLAMAGAFWAAFVVALAVLSISGHCMVAAWSFTPVCGGRFWWVLAASPEILVFVLFMLTDPKTVPSGRAGRVFFGASLGLLAVVLIAPQTVEFGAKVALLASLAILNPARGLFDRLLPESGRRESGLWRLRPGYRLAWCAAAVVVVGATIVVAGVPARSPALAVAAGGRVPVDLVVDTEALPSVTIDPAVYELAPDLDDAEAHAIAVDLAENLEIEKQAVIRRDAELLAVGSFGDRAEEIRASIDRAVVGRPFTVRDYDLHSLRLMVIRQGQQGAALAFFASATRIEITYGSSGEEESRIISECGPLFVMRRLGGDRWRLVEVFEEGRCS